jgi:hypothetical protein
VIAALVLAPLAAAWLAVLVRRASGGRGSRQYVLLSFPVALLFFTIPVVFAVFKLVVGFQRIAADGLTGPAAVAPLSVGIWLASWLGCAGFAGVVGAAAVLERRAAAAFSPPAPAPVRSDAPAAPPTRWRTVLLVGSSLLLLPALAYAQRSLRIPRLVMDAARTLERGEHLSAAGISAMSRTIASEAIGAILFGITLTLALALSTLANGAVDRADADERQLVRYTRVLLLASAAAVLWIAARGAIDSRFF